jgi:multiple sugar transport system ATP-binding protein
MRERVANVQIRNVGKVFGSTRVQNNVSLGIEPGEFVSLVGPSGCGKTTIMRIVAGPEGITSASIAIAGETVMGVRVAERDVAMVFQNYALYQHLSVAENLAVPLVMRRLSAVQRLPFIGKHFSDGSAIRAAIQTETRQTTEMLGIGHLMARTKTLAPQDMSLWKPATPVIFSQHVCKCQIRLHSHRKLIAGSSIGNPANCRQPRQYR